MGETPRPGTLPGTVVGLDDLEDGHDDAPTTERAHFAAGSEVHDLDALLAAYLLDIDVDVPRVAAAPARILLVEADPGTRRAIAEMLETGGHVVSAAASTVEATYLLQRQRFDLVIADAAAEPTGPALRSATRAHYPPPPLIVMSDDPRLAATWSATDHAAARFVAKPVRGLLLLAAIDHALRGPER